MKTKGLKSVIAAVFSVILVSLYAFSSAYAESTIMYVVVEEGSVLNVRREPGGSRIEAYLERGEAVKVVDTYRGWAKLVNVGEGGGYASLDYLSYETPPEPEDFVVIGNGRVHVRSRPAGSHVRWLHPGDEVRVYGYVFADGHQWAMIQNGYVMGDFLAKE